MTRLATSFSLKPLLDLTGAAQFFAGIAANESAHSLRSARTRRVLNSYLWMMMLPLVSGVRSRL